MNRLRATGASPVTVVLALALLVLAPVLVAPGIDSKRAAYRYLFVADITRSMLVEDYVDARGRAVTRLAMAKSAMRRAVRELPCGAQVGIGVFTGWQPAILFRPVEVCAHRSEITTVIEHLDWRTTWASLSNVARALYNTLGYIEDWRPAPPALVFLTDGDESPNLEVYGTLPDLPITPGQIDGLIVGVGATHASPIPRYSIEGEYLGYFGVDRDPMTSALEQAHLRELAEQTGLNYRRLRAPGDLAAFLDNPAYAQARVVTRSIGWLFAALALALLIARYLLVPLVSAWNPVAARANNAR